MDLVQLPWYQLALALAIAIGAFEWIFKKLGGRSSINDVSNYSSKIGFPVPNAQARCSQSSCRFPGSRHGAQENHLHVESEQNKTEKIRLFPERLGRGGGGGWRPGHQEEVDGRGAGAEGGLARDLGQRKVRRSRNPVS